MTPSTKLRFRLYITALTITGLLFVGGGLLLALKLHHSSSPAHSPVREDQIGLGAVIYVPDSWTRRAINTGWIYWTGCAHLGLKSIEATGTPTQVLNALDPTAATEYAPVVGHNFAFYPGFEIIQVQNGIDVMVLIDKAHCPETMQAINSIQMASVG